MDLDKLTVPTSESTCGSGRLLFIGYDYHEYTRAIHAEFVRMGYDAYYFSIQPSDLHFKLARRASELLYGSMLAAYHRKIIDSFERDTLSHVVFLQAHQISIDNLEYLRNRQRGAKFTLYNWDSVSTHDYRDRLRFFDAAWTFDPVDACELNIGHLPLFCIRRFQEVVSTPSSPFSVYFVGNIVNPARYRALRSFENHCIEAGIGFKAYMATTVHGWTTMVQAGIWPRDVAFRPISPAKFEELISHSTAVFDFANHRQAGMTMRVIENLCMGKKIITSNVRLRFADFYSSDRIFIFEGDDYSGLRDFLATPIERPNERFSCFHIQNFATTLVGA